MSEEEKLKEDFLQFQQAQQQIQALMIQKQNIQVQSTEIENALKEIEKAKDEDLYEIVGNVMIKKSKDELIKSLKEKKELLDLRISTIDKQIEKISEKASELQKKLAKQIK